MSRRKKGRVVNGILLLNKSIGVTSNRALQQCKRLFYAQKAGHTGSLDPMATGVLPLCFGEATKFSQYLLNADKSYKATIRFGQKSSTGDAEGDIIESKDASGVKPSAIEACLSTLIGTSEQLPPMYSAIKQNGQPLYKLARQGQVVARKSRQITLYDLELTDFNDGHMPEAEVRVRCSKGTYVRTLAEDIAEKLGTVAHLTALERTAVGDFLLADTVTFADLQNQEAESHYNGLDKLLISTELAVNHLPLVELKSGEGYYIKQGQAVFVPQLPLSGLVRIKETDGQFLGIGEILDDGRVEPRRLVATGTQ